ncbi:hypothetical protein [Streptomyces sp. NPDC059781]|uniref:hypothetical protein n=1 Tax=Streptomyces sp. NPDC059781 TaxID=3346943 RepID=UPI003647143B
MFTSQKIAAAATAGILGSFALIGLGAAQAFAHNGGDACADVDSKTVSCKQTQECSGGGQVTCTSTVTLGKESEVADELAGTAFFSKGSAPRSSAS